MNEPKTITTPKTAEAWNIEQGKGHHSFRYELRQCFCVGPQNGEPLCPCKMTQVEIRDGRYIQREVDLGPVR